MHTHGKKESKVLHVATSFQEHLPTNLLLSISLPTGQYFNSSLSLSRYRAHPTLEGENHTAKGEKVLLRATWKKEGEWVREAAVTSKDGGKTWDPYFDVRFKKHK